MNAEVLHVFSESSVGNNNPTYIGDWTPATVFKSLRINLYATEVVTLLC